MNTCEECMDYFNPETGEFEKRIMRAPGNYNQDIASMESATETPLDEESLTQQNTEDETNINRIVDRFTRTGQLPLQPKPAMFGDFTEVPTRQEAENRIIEGREAFMRLPAAIRSEFDNNASDWLDAVDQAASGGNKEECRRLGIEFENDPPEPPRGGETVTEKPVT